MIDWLVSKDAVLYEDALAFMDERVAAIHEGEARECVWLLEHPPLYTAGTSAKESDLLDPRFPVFKTGRGGEYTYHGPGQRVAYVMLDLKKHAQRCHPCGSRDLGDKEQPDSGLRRNDTKRVMPDVKQYVCDLEQWIINALGAFGVQGERQEGRIGIWVNTPQGDQKVAAIGVRVRHWITLHGIAINVNPDLSHFGGIVPCGISDAGVTSLHDLGVDATMEEVGEALKKTWNEVF